MQTLDEIREITESRLKSVIAGLPTSPGVYLFKNSNDNIIYVGKAKSLRSRVRSYFQKGRPVDAKTRAMISHIVNLDFFLVDNEAEALILEDTLIKKHKPKYNILLRDDKSYPYIKITKEDYPKIYVTRTVRKDGAKYIGPFTEVRNMKQILKTLRSIFMFRTCDLNITQESIEKKKHKICLDYHIKKCEGPCEGLVSQIKYEQNVKYVIQMLNGRTREVEAILEKQMNQLSEEMRFEEAANIRNKLALLHEFSAKQKMVSADRADRDIFGVAKTDNYACSLVFKIREGKLIGKRHFMVNNVSDTDLSSILQRTIEAWYLENDFIPKEIILPEEPDELEYLTDWLSEKKGKTIRIFIPKAGDKKELVSMAISNAEHLLQDYVDALSRREQAVPRSVLSLQRDLRLSNVPLRIECFDNSHLQGSEYVSSMVVFIDGKPKKSEYRKYKIKEVLQNDDFAAMREVIKRRYTRLLNEINETKKNKDDDKTPKLPDLIIIDGGKGQLSSALDILNELNLNIPIIGLAKRLEEVFFPNKSEALMLPRTSSSLKLLQHLRDEAHRFAITYHRLLRDKRTFTTELTEIPGIGKKTAEKLLINFGSVEGIRNSTVDEVSQFVPYKLAVVVKQFFEQKENNANK